MKFLTEKPYNNVSVKREYSIDKYTPYNPAYTVNLLYIKTIKGSGNTGTKELMCPFCGEKLIVTKYTDFGRYEDRTDDTYHYHRTIEHTCDTIEELQSQISQANMIESEIRDITAKEISPREVAIKNICKYIGTTIQDKTMFIESNGRIYKF
jgi:hypothetical protein